MHIDKTSNTAEKWSYLKNQEVNYIKLSTFLVKISLLCIKKKSFLGQKQNTKKRGKLHFCTRKNCRATPSASAYFSVISPGGPGNGPRSDDLLCLTLNKITAAVTTSAAATSTISHQTHPFPCDAPIPGLGFLGSDGRRRTTKLSGFGSDPHRMEAGAIHLPAVPLLFI